MEDFFYLIWLLKTNQEIIREDLEIALDSLPRIDFEFDSQRERLSELLTGSLNGNPRDFEQFQAEALGLVQLPTEVIEEELRDSAWELYGETWKTPLYLDLVQATEYADKGSWDDFEELLQAISDKLEQEWSVYESLNLSPEEITQETLIGHRLLLEGLETWSLALDDIVRTAESKKPWDAALRTAEQASRLSTMSHLYSIRIKEQA